MKKKIRLPKSVLYIISVLEREGYEAFAVGGCVRDSLLGRKPMDWDITTSATPFEVKRCFNRTIDTGIQHGTVTVMLDGEGYEVTTYRVDGEYRDGRHPQEVSFTANLRLDLERRDFTINAMAYNETVGLVDEFDGVGDLKRGVIRCVGDAGQRFDEDALRMLRAIRFSGQLDFTVEERTRQAIVDRADHLEKISAERIRVEMTKLLVSRRADRFREVYATGMTAVFFPEFDHMMRCEQRNPHHCYTVGEHSIAGVCVINELFETAGTKGDASEVSSGNAGECGERQDGEPSWFPLLSDYVRQTLVQVCRSLTEKQHMILAVTMLLHDVAKPVVKMTDEEGTDHFHGHPEKGEQMARRILRRLTFDNETVDLAGHLIRYHDYRMKPEAKYVRRGAARVGRERMWMLFLVQYADALAQSRDMLPPKLARLEQDMRLYEQMESEGQPLSIRDLAVNGNDLIRAGVRPGPAIGEELQRLLELVLEDPECNTRERLLEEMHKNID